MNYFFKNEVNPKKISYTMARFSVFLDNPTTLYMSWSYNPEIRMNFQEGDFQDLIMPNICAVCGIQAILKLCSNCRKIKYCSVECQKKDWPIHKFNCNKE